MARGGLRQTDLFRSGAEASDLCQRLKQAELSKLQSLNMHGMNIMYSNRIVDTICTPRKN